MHPIHKSSGALGKVASNVDDNISALNVLETSDYSLQRRGESVKLSVNMALQREWCPAQCELQTYQPLLQQALGRHCQETSASSSPSQTYLYNHNIECTQLSWAGSHVPDKEWLFTPLARLEPIPLSNAEHHGKVESIYEGI